MKVDFAKAFRYPVQEAGAWVKLLVLMVMMLAFPLWFGYLVEVQKEVGEGNDEKMPNIDDFAGFLFKGLKFLLIICIFAVPPLFLLSASFGVGLVGMLTSAKMQSAAGIASGGAMALMGFLATAIVMMALWVVLPMCVVRMATSGSVGSAFDFGGVFSDMGRGPLDYVAILLSVPVIHQVAGWLVSIIPMGALLVWPLSAYMALVMGNLMGQYHRLYLTPEARGLVSAE